MCQTISSSTCSAWSLRFRTGDTHMIVAPALCQRFWVFALALAWASLQLTCRQPECRPYVYVEQHARVITAFRSCRLAGIALVNRRCRAICMQPSKIWERMDLRLSWETGSVVDRAGLLRFLLQRLPHIRSFHLQKLSSVGCLRSLTANRILTDCRPPPGPFCSFERARSS